MTTITGAGTIHPEDAAVLREWLSTTAEHDRREVARVREMSRISGMKCVYDLSIFDIEWSPIYWHTSEAPIAWVNASGDRRPGPDYPKDPTP